MLITLIMIDVGYELQARASEEARAASSRQQRE